MPDAALHQKRKQTSNCDLFFMLMPHTRAKSNAILFFNKISISFVGQLQAEDFKMTDVTETYGTSRSPGWFPQTQNTYAAKKNQARMSGE